MTQWRSPDGLRARTSVFRVLDPRVTTPDTKRTALSDRVWNRFRDDPQGLWSAAAVSLQALREGRAEADAIQRQDSPQPTRGPGAWAGGYATERVDGLRWVYVMRLAQKPTGLKLMDGDSFLKIGRSHDVDDRARQLNASFPDALGLSWRPIDAVLMDTEADAHAVEQRTLSKLHDAGWSAGGEFVRGDPAAVGVVLRASALDE
ncbi:GIY-YIG nuclease family protein [Brevundimonas sp. SL130]|uniref:GIY-YIG nuclease family protein n=1 Tax=Brevundimonas sp. SL130 TaxID=2995143 RepID=UPI00226D1EC9|nr:GIY-YIG nuclease family protein [Brevundimonas sp. SL130]WAC59644.1 GIY-YIG nuclease family protein [Brevundimonas sp. SL130]